MKKNIGAGCGVLIIKNNKILLGLRNDNPNLADSELHEEGTWTLPGGNIEYGETFEEAAKRETKEECNLDIDNIEIICVQTDKNKYAHYISIGMVANTFHGEIKVMEPNEIIKWEWFDINSLPNNLFTPTKKTISCYKNKKFYMG